MRNKKQKISPMARDMQMSDKEVDKVLNYCHHKKLDNDNYLALVKALFPNSKEDVIKAWFMFTEGKSAMSNKPKSDLDELKHICVSMLNINGFLYKDGKVIPQNDISTPPQSKGKRKNTEKTLSYIA